MKPIRIGILGTSNVAFRRFVPSIKQMPMFEYVGLAIADISEWAEPVDIATYTRLCQQEKAKAEDFYREYAGTNSFGYNAFLRSDQIDAVYIPLPPALHYKWAKHALACGKHVLLEKPFTTRLAHTEELVTLAKEKKLALHENYAFCYHNQVKSIIDLVRDGVIGEPRQIRAAFGFPFRGAADFRYNKALGGGALLDCGGYPIKISSMLLGASACVTSASLCQTEGNDVDVFGSATLQNAHGLTAQVSFGMDNGYRCEVEVWGSKGYLMAPRVYTAPDDLAPEIIVMNPERTLVQALPDKQFAASARRFSASIESDALREASYGDILGQARLIEDVFVLGGNQV